MALWIRKLHLHFQSTNMKPYSFTVKCVFISWCTIPFNPYKTLLNSQNWLLFYTHLQVEKQRWFRVVTWTRFHERSPVGWSLCRAWRSSKPVSIQGHVRPQSNQSEVRRYSSASWRRSWDPERRGHFLKFFGLCTTKFTKVFAFYICFPIFCDDSAIQRKSHFLKKKKK